MFDINLASLLMEFADFVITLVTKYPRLALMILLAMVLGGDRARRR